MSSGDGEFPYGYALRRNGSCLNDETDCGPTWGGYHACCPYSTTCPSGTDTSVCCHYESDCTSLIVGHPHCGDQTANLYWANNYFCCSNGTYAFSRQNGWVGCTDDMSEVGSDMKQLVIVSSASASTSTISTTVASSTASLVTSTTASTSATATPTSEPSADNPSSSKNTGAIAGGVVGGVAGVAFLLVLAWYLYRHRNTQSQNVRSQNDEVFTQEIADAHRPRLQVIGELDTHKDYEPAELPSYR